jgi:hypothetical protein
MSAEDAKTETWVYAGKRLTRDKKLVDCWQDPENNICLYKNMAGLLCGKYEAKVERVNGTTTIYGKPRWLEGFDYNLKEEWTVADNSARVQHTQHRREVRAKKGDDHLDRAIERLLPYARACRTRQDKDALIATVLRRLLETW